MESFEKILDRFGQEVLLRTAEGERPIRAFLQPLWRRDERTEGDYSPIGWLDGRLWLYLGREAVESGDALSWNGMEFLVRSGRPYYIGGTLSHYQASLERRREAECGS